jgi:hypothetical protein
MERPDERGFDHVTLRVLSWRFVRLQVLPYGAAMTLVITTWLAGGLIGADRELGPLAWLMLAGTLLVLACWLVAMTLVFRRLGLWGLLAIPSASLVALTATGLPLLTGACWLANACI